MAHVPFSGTAGKIPRIKVGDIARKHVPVGILGMRILGTIVFGDRDHSQKVGPTDGWMVDLGDGSRQDGSEKGFD